MINSTNKLINWVLYFLVAIIWGSSFILMKRGMFGVNGEPTLTAYQLAAIRILSAGVALLPIGILQFKKIPQNKKKYVFLSALIGSMIPAFLFCIAETKINSSLAGFLNALTPAFTISIGLVFFGNYFQKNKLLGVAIAFVGMLLLFLANKELNLEYLSYAALVVIATICYGFNVNIVNRFLKDISPIKIAAVGFSYLILPAFSILIFTGYFKLPLQNREIIYSTLSGFTLGILGTALATILFYMLLKRAGTVFTSMVTYGIPFISLGWGLLEGDLINSIQIAGLAIILTGVYMTNK